MTVIPNLSPEDTANNATTHLDKRSVRESVDLQGFPNIISGSYADIRPRRYMEDEHIRTDDLNPYTGSLPYPTAFYGVFDGHGGPEAATYIKNNAIRLFLQNLQIHQEEEEESSEVRVSSSSKKSKGEREKKKWVFGNGYKGGHDKNTLTLKDN